MSEFSGTERGGHCTENHRNRAKKLRYKNEKRDIEPPEKEEWMSLESCRQFNDGMTESAKKSNGTFLSCVMVKILLQ